LFCVMLFTMAIIFISNLLKPTSSQECPIYEITYEETLKSFDTPEEKNAIKTCFCLQQDINELKDNKELNEYCWDVILENILNLLFSIGTALMVVIVNFILKISTKALALFSKYKSIT
jgi:hypothetical protein